MTDSCRNHRGEGRIKIKGADKEAETRRGLQIRSKKKSNVENWGKGKLRKKQGKIDDGQGTPNARPAEEMVGKTET